MAEGRGPPFTVDRVREVDRQLGELTAKAIASGTQAELFAPVRGVVRRLESDPLGWGDPRYRTQHPGGVVCQALWPPLLNVHYVVFEPEAVVMLLDVKALPGSSLA
jgi:hypothetical protein